MITILGLGPGSIDYLTLKAWNKLQQIDALHLRTSRHPCVSMLPAKLRCVSFDDVYQTHDQFEDVYQEIADRILETARRDGHVVYAVPGDPLVGEASVTRIIERGHAEAINVEIIPRA